MTIELNLLSNTCTVSLKPYFSHTDLTVSNVNKQADEISPRNGSAFSMEVEVPRLLGTDITWALMGIKRNRLKQQFYLF